MASKLKRALIFWTHTYILSVMSPTDFHHGWAIFGPLADKNTRKESLAGLPSSKKVPNIFVHVLIHVCQFETWYRHRVDSATHGFRVSIQSGPSDLLYSLKWVKVIFPHLWPQKLYRSFRFDTHTYIASILNPTDFRSFFLHVLRYDLETWHIHPVGGTTHQVWVSL